MITTTDDILASARHYVDDEHAAVAQWIPDATWMGWMNHEYRRAYRQAVMSGLIVPMYTDETLVYDPSVDATATPGYTLAGKPMAIVGVWQGVAGSSAFRRLRPAQPAGGAFPARGEATGTGISWAAYAFGADIKLVLYPMPGDVSDYTCRFVAEPPVLVGGTPTPTPGAGETLSVNLPLGMDDLIALRMANRALIKEGSGSSNLTRLIAQTELDLEMAAHSRITGDAPRVRSTRRPLHADRNSVTTVPSDYPGEWYWF